MRSSEAASRRRSPQASQRSSVITSYSIHYTKLYDTLRASAIMSFVLRRHPHDAHLGLQADALLPLHRRAHLVQQPLDVGGRGTAGVDDEVGVLLGDAGPAAAPSYNFV